MSEVHRLDERIVALCSYTEQGRSSREIGEVMLAHECIFHRPDATWQVVARPTIFALEERLNALRVPTLIVVGDEDEPCVEPALFMKRAIPGAGLAVLPRTGHTLNLEEPRLFNELVGDFVRAVELGRWD